MTSPETLAVERFLHRFIDGPHLGGRLRTGNHHVIRHVAVFPNIEDEHVQRLFVIRRGGGGLRQLTKIDFYHGHFLSGA